MGFPVPRGMAEESIQSASGDLAIYVEFPIDLIKFGQKGRHILHFFPCFGQLGKSQRADHYLYARFLPYSSYSPRSRDPNALRCIVYTYNGENQSTGPHKGMNDYKGFHKLYTKFTIGT